MRRSGRESAFTVVEVVIAVLLMMMVVTGMVLAMNGSSQLRGATRLQASMTHTGQRMIEQLASDRDWMETCKSGSCEIASVLSDPSNPDLRKLDGVDGSVEVVDYPKTSATAVDSDVDGTGPKDEDGVIPDYYQINIAIVPEADVIARYPGDAASLTRTFETSLDRKGNVLRGSLRVDACVVRNQVDERMSIDGCDESGTTNVRMNDCPTDPPNDGAFTKCPSAFNWVRNAPQNTPTTEPSPFVAIQKVPPSGYSFSIKNLSTGESSISSGAARKIDGGYVFENITAGTYEITGLPASYSTGGVSHPRWQTKEIPSYHNDPGGSVGVQPGVKNQALVMFRPPRTNGGIEFYFDRIVHHYGLVKQTSGPEKVGGNFAYEGEKWAKTDSYEGEGAAGFCEANMKPIPVDGTVMYQPISDDGSTSDIAKYSTKDYSLGYTTFEGGVVEPKTVTYDRQCWIYLTGYASSVSKPNCVLAAYRFSMTRWDMAYDLPGAVATLDGAPIEYSFRFCTYFRDEMYHTSYHAARLPDKILPGAVKTAVYEVAPRPTTREVNFGPGNSLATATYPRAYCVVRGHTTHQNSQDQAECQPGRGIDSLFPGLHTDVMAPSDASVTSPNGGGSESNAANAAANDNASVPPRGMPAWATGGGLWVRTNGSLVARQGGSNVNVSDPLIRLRGDGECYWRGGPYLPQPWEGECGKCNMMWKKNQQFSNTCAMLTRTCVNRIVVEIKTYSDGWNNFEGGGETSTVGYYGPTRVPPKAGGDGAGCVRYTPAWLCDNRPPTVVDGNCKAYVPPPPATITLRPSVHQVSAGKARVGSKGVDQKIAVT